MSVTRRALLLGAAATALATRDAFAQREGDAAVLDKLTRLEQVSVLVYTAASDSTVLESRLAETARLFRDHEQEHVDALGTALEALGGARPPVPRNAAELDRAIKELGIDKSFARLRSQTDILRFAIDLEQVSVAAYYDACQRLQDAQLLQTAVSIMGNEGQHLVVLRQALGEPPLPNPLETGHR